MVDVRDQYYVGSWLHFMELKFNGVVDAENGIFYADFNGNGQFDDEEYIDIPVGSNGRIDTAAFKSEVINSISAETKTPALAEATISTEQRPGLTEREYDRKRFERAPAVRFAKGFSEKTYEEGGKMVEGSVGLYDLCDSGVRKKTAPKSGVSYAAMTSACIAGGVLTGIGEYIFGGGAIDEALEIGSDIASGDAERMGRGVALAGIRALQFSGSARTPKAPSSGGRFIIAEPVSNGSTLAYSLAGAGETVVVTGGTVQRGVIAFSVGSGEAGQTRPKIEKRYSDDQLNLIIRKHNGDLAKAAEETGYSEVYIRYGRIMKAKEGSPLYRHKLDIKKAEAAARKPGAIPYVPDYVIMNVLREHGFKIRNAAKDPRLKGLTPKQIKNKVTSADIRSDLHEARLHFFRSKKQRRAKTAKPRNGGPQSDEWLAGKLEEWARKDNINGIFTDPEVDITPYGLEWRIRNAPEESTLSEWAGTTFHPKKKSQ